MSFCLDALHRALALGTPEIFNSDQGSQFTSGAFTGVLREAEIAISMDGRGRAYDNIFIERLWRSAKYEEVYLRDYATATEAADGLNRYFAFYNYARPHQSLGWQTPARVYGIEPSLAHERWLAEYQSYGGQSELRAAAAPLALRAPSTAAARKGAIHLNSMG